MYALPFSTPHGRHEGCGDTQANADGHYEIALFRNSRIKAGALTGPSLRVPFRNRLGVPLTPLRTPLLKSRCTRAANRPERAKSIKSSASPSVFPYSVRSESESAS